MGDYIYQQCSAVSPAAGQKKRPVKSKKKPTFHTIYMV